MWAHRSRVPSIVVGDSWRQVLEATGRLHLQSESSVMNASAQQASLLSTQPRTQVRGMVLLTCRADLPTSVKLI